MSVTSGGVHEVCTVNLKRYEFLEIEGLHAWVGLAGRARAEAYFTLTFAMLPPFHSVMLSSCENKTKLAS